MNVGDGNDVINQPSEAVIDELNQHKNNVNHLSPGKTTSGDNKRRKRVKYAPDRKSSARNDSKSNREIGRYRSEACRRQETVTSSEKQEQLVTWSPTVRIRRRIVWRRRMSVDSAVESSECWRCKHPVVLTTDKIVDATSRYDDDSDVSSTDSDDDTRQLISPQSRTRQQQTANKNPTIAAKSGNQISGEILLNLDELGLYDQVPVGEVVPKMEEVQCFTMLS